MPRFRPRGMLAKSAMEDLDRHTLSKIPTVYGVLAYLSSLRDPNTGVYRHHGLSSSFGRDEATSALRESHEAIFREWINLTLSDKYEDLTKYLAAFEPPVSQTIRHWRQTRVYVTCVSPQASTAEKHLFITDLEACLVALSYEAAAEESAQASLPPA